MDTKRKSKIVDGKLLSDLRASKLAEEKRFLNDLKEFELDLTPCAPAESTHPEIEEIDPRDFRIINGIMLPADQPYLPSPPSTELPAERRICPYLTRENGADYGLYLHYLEATGKTRRTRSEYGIDLRRWRRELQGNLTIEQINRVLQELKTHRAIRMLNTLKSYARYCNFHGDSRLLTLLSTSLNLYHPTLPKKAQKSPTDTLSQPEVQTYRILAKDLCLQQKKEGVWIALCLSGVQPGSIGTVELLDKTLRFTKRGRVKEIRIESWLSKAMTSIQNWRLGRRSIHQGVIQYEITPRALNRAAADTARRSSDP